MKIMAIAFCTLLGLTGLTACTNILTAVNSGNIADVDMAISGGEDVNRRDNEGNTPLILAAKHGDLGIVITLIKHGADLKAKNKDGYDALSALTNYSIASPSGTTTKGGETPEPMGIMTEGHLQTAAYLINQGANVNSKDNDGNTPLIIAARLNKKALIELYLSNGANVNDANKWGYTALITAARKGYSDIICPLLLQGADANAIDSTGRIALQYAEQNGHQKISQLIMGGCPRSNRPEEREIAERSSKALEKKIAAEQEVEKLIESLRSQDPYTRREAARKLGELKESSAVVPLIGALKDDDPYVRRRAAVALGNIGDLRAVDPLIKALGDNDAFVQKYSVESLSMLSGEKFGSDAKKWQDWWTQKVRKH